MSSASKKGKSKTGPESLTGCFALRSPPCSMADVLVLSALLQRSGSTRGHLHELFPEPVVASTHPIGCRLSGSLLPLGIPVVSRSGPFLHLREENKAVFLTLRVLVLNRGLIDTIVHQLSGAHRYSGPSRLPSSDGGENTPTTTTTMIDPGDILLSPFSGLRLMPPPPKT